MVKFSTIMGNLGFMNRCGLIFDIYQFQLDVLIYLFIFFLVYLVLRLGGCLRLV